MEKGVLITIEGVDSVGKATQAKLLKESFEEQGYEVLSLTFPDYSTETGKLVGRYLNGDFGKAIELDPILSGALYALDRAKYVETIKAAIDTGVIVICDRYSGSNQAFQAIKALTKAKQREVASTLHKIEHHEIGLPEPDLTIFLDAHPVIALELMEKRQAGNGEIQRKDQHESNTAFLEAAYNAYLDLRDDKWVTVNCISEAKLRPIRDIHEEVYNACSQII